MASMFQVPGRSLADLRTVQFPSQYSVRISRARGIDMYECEVRSDGVYLLPAGKNGAQNSAQEDFETSDSSQESYHQLRLNFDSLPQPSVLGSIIGGVTQQTLRQAVLTNATVITPMMMRHIGRPPTQEEMDLVANYTAQGIQTGSRGPFLGTVAGLAQQLRTARSGYWYFPLPFRLPMSYARGSEKNPFNPELFKIGARTLLTGQAAYTAHKMIRMSLYAFAGYMLGRMYLNVNANGAAIRAASDPKLAAAKQATDAQMAKRREEFMEEMGRKRPQPSSGKSASTSDSAVFSRVPAVTRASDDASPTGGAGVWDDTNVEPDAFKEDRSAETALGSENAPGSDRFADAQDKSMRHPRQHQGSFEKLQRQSTTAGQPVGNDEDFFSQSSTESQPQGPAPAASQSQPSGNSWDRLRRGGPSPAPRRAKPSVADDGQSPIAQDGDEKSQAQKEFDAMLDRERAGDESKGSSRRW